MKKRITPIPLAPPKLKMDTIESGNLPNADEVNQTVAQLTGKNIEGTTTPKKINFPAATNEDNSSSAADPGPLYSHGSLDGSSGIPYVPGPPTIFNHSEQVYPAPSPVVTTPVIPQVVQQRTVVLKTFGRPPKPEAVGRDKFTTRLKTELVVELKTRAAKRKITVADLVEMIVGENFERY
jgi:hypothetical protein